MYDKTTYTTEDNQSVTKEYFYENNALYKLDFIELINGTFTITNDFVYVGDTTRIYEISYNIDKTSNGTTSDDIEVIYRYLYDNIGNISSVSYIEGASLKTYEHYEYDEMNQLHVVDSRDYTFSEAALNGTNYTKYYYYDLRGNIIDIKTFNYGVNDYIELVIPSEYRTNSGSIDIYEVVSGDTTLDVGDTLSLSYSYYLDNLAMPPDPVPMPMITACDYSNVDTSTAGYYLVDCSAHGKFGSIYILDFGVLITVGEPVAGDRTPEEHIRYNYNTDWLDQLESTDTITYNPDGTVDTITTVQSFTYDDQGNPTRIDGFNYNDTVYHHAILEYQGRQLTKISVCDEYDEIVSISYTYNDQGYRISKTIDNGISQTISYTLLGDKVLFETDGTYGIIYTYDFDGNLISFNYDSDVDSSPNGVEYYYLRNQQGDIVKIIDENGNVVVEYFYDAWGNIVKTVDSSGINLANINPYRYRGYRYDEETALYYLSSRYYDANIGRFINSDGLLGAQGNILGHNMYAYTQNNPVMYSDISGYAPEWLKTVGIVLVAVIVVVAITALVTLTAGAAAYIILGAAAQTGIASVMIGAASGGLIAGSISLVGQSSLGDESIDFGTLVLDTFTGSTFGAISGFGGVGATLGTKMAMGGTKVGLAIASSILHGMNKGLSPKEIWSTSNRQGINTMLLQTTLVFGSAFFCGSGTSGIINKLTTNPNATSSMIISGSMLFDFAFNRNEE